MTSELKDEFEYYLKNQEELLEKYRGKVVVIFGEKVLGAYANENEAIQETSKTHKLGTFLVQRVEPGTSSYTRTYRSRVVFAS